MIRRLLLVLVASGLALTESASAQGVGSVYDFFRDTQAKPSAPKPTRTVRTRWTDIPANELECIDQALRKEGTSARTLQRRGVAQTNERVVKLRAECQKQLAQAPAPVAVPKSKFSVDGLSLGSLAPTELDNYSEFQCGPSELFAGLTWCQRAERERIGRRELSVSTSVLHTQDGRAAYVNQASEPPGFDAAGVEKELERLSAHFGKPANVLRIPQKDGLPNAIIASWGTIKLEPLDPESVKMVAAGESPRKGLLADFLGNFRRSAKLGLPIYRLSSGSGYVWSASADRNGRGYQRTFVYDANMAASPSAPATAAAPPATGSEATVADADKAAADKAAADKAAADKAAAEKAAAEKVAALNIAAETAAAEKAAAERAAADKAAAEKAAALRAAAEKAATEKAATEKAAADKAAAEKAAAVKAAAEKAAADKAAAEKVAALNAAAERAATEKAAADKAAAARLAALRAAADKATAEKEAALKVAAEKAAAEKAAALKTAVEKAASEREAALKAAVEKAASERKAALKAAAEKAASEREAALKAAAEKAAAEKEAALKAAAEKAAAEKETALKAAAEKAAAEKAAALKAAAEKGTADRAVGDKVAALQAAAEKAAAEKEAALKAAAEKAAAEKAAALKAAAERAAADKAAALKAAAEKAAAEKEVALKAAAEKAAAEKAAALKAASEKTAAERGGGQKLALAARTGLGESATERAAAAPKVEQRPAKFRGLFVGMPSDQFAAAIKELGFDMKLQVSSYQSGDSTEHHLLLEVMAKGADRPLMYVDVRNEAPLSDKFASLYGLKVLDKASDYTIFSGLNPPQLPKFTVRRLVFYPAFFDATGTSGKDFARTLLDKYRFVGAKLRDGAQTDQCDQCLVGLLNTGEAVTLRLDSDGHWALEVEQASNDFAKHFRAPKL
ncbi:MAG: histone H1-like repetitive region-containing protein [Rhodoplanes sp.]